MPDDAKIMGIGRPNIQLITDYAGTQTEKKLSLHLEIPKLTGNQERKILEAIQSSIDQKDRKELRKALKKILKAKRLHFKGGYRLLDGLTSDPATDGELDETDPEGLLTKLDEDELREPPAPKPPARRK